MFIRNAAEKEILTDDHVIMVRREEIIDAVYRMNKKFDGNIEYEVREKDVTRGEWIMKFRARDVLKPGHSLTHPAVIYGRKQRIPTACWHVHYEVFINLPQRAAIYHDKVWYPVSAQRFPVWEQRRGFKSIIVTELCECVDPLSYPPRGGDWREYY